MKILVACEFSAVVRDAFRTHGDDAWSCDTEPTEGDPTWHIQDDVFADGVLVGALGEERWDMLIGFPPCTHLASSGARWWPEKRVDGRQAAAIDFVINLYRAPISLVAIENPVGHLSTAWRKPDQIIQPWQYGHGEVKTTCLWLKGLPTLRPTLIVPGREQRVWRMGQHVKVGRVRERSRTYPGVAKAMAEQWGTLIA